MARTPLRISFLGGRTDLPAFYREEEGAVLSVTIDKYIHIILRTSFDESIRLSYGQTEIRQSPAEIDHKIFRHILTSYGSQWRLQDGGRGLDITSLSDVPPGTGLGSSSAFTVSLLHALKTRIGQAADGIQLAAEASRIEIDELGEPIGKQDQYAAGIGGLQYIRFLPSGEVIATPVACSMTLKRELEASILVFYTGITRSASAILSLREGHAAAKRDVLREMKKLAERLKNLLENGGSVREFGDILHEGWSLKKAVASGISAPQIDEWYARAMNAGAWGGKILGAGGGGFLMMLAHPDTHAGIQSALRELRHVPVEFENQGSRIIHAG